MLDSLRSEKFKIMKGLSLLLVEGADAGYFCMYACKAYKLENIQVVDFGGNEDLNQNLSILKLLPGYENVPALGILRDAEKDAMAAIRSVQSSLQKNDLPIPVCPYEFCQEDVGIVFGIFPGSDRGGVYENGTLEDLCIGSVEADENWECVDTYIKCVQRKETLKHIHKARLYTYLAGKEGYAGCKLGEAAKKGVWDWGSVKFNKFRTMLEVLNNSAKV
jgi:hypothetical protein